MSVSPYRRGAPALAALVGLVVLGAATLVSIERRDMRATKTAPPPPPPEPPPLVVPVETDPPGARVTYVDKERGPVTACTTTPCRMELPSARLASLKVVFHVRGRDRFLVPAAELTQVPGVAVHVSIPAPPPPELRLGAVTSPASLPDAVVTRIVRRHLGRVRKCIDEGAQRDALLDGVVLARLRVDRHGAVVSSHDDGTTMSEPQTVGCVHRVLRQVTFPEPTGGAAVDVTVPIVYDRTSS